MADKILNTGLDALLGDVATPNKQSIKEIELNQIKPNRFQPRQTFDEQKITELSQSIATHGILSPILVRETGAGGYELIAGERRLRAAKKVGLETAPCMVDSAEDQLSLELALIENLQREDLNPIEEARGYDRLKREFSLTQDKIAEVTGKARSSVANSMRLLNLPTSIIDLLYAGDLEKGHAKILASMDPKEAEELAKKIVSLGSMEARIFAWPFSRSPAYRRSIMEVGKFNNLIELATELRALPVTSAILSCVNENSLFSRS